MKKFAFLLLLLPFTVFAATDISLIDFQQCKQSSNDIIGCLKQSIAAEDKRIEELHQNLVSSSTKDDAFLRKNAHQAWQHYRKSRCGAHNNTKRLKNTLCHLSMTKHRRLELEHIAYNKSHKLADSNVHKRSQHH